MNKDNLKKINTEISNIIENIANISQCLEVLENGLYFATERHDKDMTKPCAACTDLILALLVNEQDKLETVNEKLNKIIDL